MLRRLTLVLLTGLSLPYSQVPPCGTHHETNTAKGVVETFVDVVPTCEGGGPLYTITTTSNLIEHETIFDDGRVHATFTQTGTFTAVPLEDPTLPSYTGKFTVWGGFNANGSTVNGTFTFSVAEQARTAQPSRNHNVDHFNVRPDGTVAGVLPLPLIHFRVCTGPLEHPRGLVVDAQRERRVGSPM